jgi:flagellar protein FliS
MNASRAYLRNQVESASPGELVVLMYDGLLRFSREASERLRLGTVSDNAAAAHAVSRAIDIVTELNATLSHAVDPEFCDRMSRLYEFFADRLSEAARTWDARPIDQVLPLMEQLRDAWVEGVRNLRAAPAVAGV